MRAERRRLIADAVVSGLIGYALVVACFLIWNLASGRPPFHTAALLGSALFGGLRDPALLTVDAGMVIAFNGVHLLVFLGFSLFAAWLVYEAERHPEFWYLAFCLFVVGAVAGYAAMLAMSLLVGSLLSPWAIVAASLLSAVGMAGYLVGSHGALIRTVRSAGERLGTVD
ncbi:MAG TPA: hypothetical protein VMM12_13620 [Longimicrobiales bacterium]|nr:hypothetical protein [Longimicrobiales bacterium]